MLSWRTRELELPPWKPPSRKSGLSGCECWMRRLLLFTTLLVQLSCSEISPEPVRPQPIDCNVLRLTLPPRLDAQDCGGEWPGRVCLSVDNALDLYHWIGRVEETRRDLERCPLVQLVDAP